ncbi:protein HIGH ARSENIC CONTENT 1 [Citrus sinensis]|uniref:Protein HIGH ARSENIC CONTENT 1 n=1 Tax=Citrus sinensis TaxID=2711 RepID=A0ACB8ICT8_CITSI|nr:protein HIGH ARSENIC CONTENT 1 [Citrus sinensis]KAH9694741.1 protein HIGH ARSENIC CONTENT 1 [Citrus sinensis]
MMSCRNIFALTKLRKNSFIPIRTIIDVGKRPAGDVASVGVDTAKDLLSSGHRFLDVRTTEEFNESHVHGALNVPYLFITQEGRVKNPEFLTQVASVCSKEDHIIVGCKSGIRSLCACVDLLNAGYEHVTSMEGGYSAWLDKELAEDK